MDQNDDGVSTFIVALWNTKERGTHFDLFFWDESASQRRGSADVMKRETLKFRPQPAAEISLRYIAGKGSNIQRVR